MSKKARHSLRSKSRNQKSSNKRSRKSSRKFKTRIATDPSVISKRKSHKRTRSISKSAKKRRPKRRGSTSIRRPTLPSENKTAKKTTRKTEMKVDELNDSPFTTSFPVKSKGKDRRIVASYSRPDNQRPAEKEVSTFNHIEQYMTPIFSAKKISISKAGKSVNEMG